MLSNCPLPDIADTKYNLLFFSENQNTNVKLNGTKSSQHKSFHQRNIFCGIQLILTPCPEHSRALLLVSQCPGSMKG